jgi:hypothetical protein
MVVVLKISASVVTIAYHDLPSNACDFYPGYGERMSVLLDARRMWGAQMFEPPQAEGTNLGQEAICLIAEGRPD